MTHAETVKRDLGGGPGSAVVYEPCKYHGTGWLCLSCKPVKACRCGGDWPCTAETDQ